MIYEAFSGMITLLLTKFMLNDVPHAAGLSTGIPKASLTKAPTPIFFTHSTTQDAYESILKGGQILPYPADGFIPVSLDGGVGSDVWGKYVFKFPMRVLPHNIAKPVFYLGTGDTIETIGSKDFSVMDMTSMFATEIMIFGPLNISQAEIITTPPPETALTKFLMPAYNELREHGRAALGLGGGAIESYTPSTLAIVSAYNRMVAKLTGVDYAVVKAFTEKHASETQWDLWWK